MVEPIEIKVPGTDRVLTCDTKADLFSPKGLDQGTALLLHELAHQDYATALDWGCGWGAIALYLAAKQPQALVWAIDANVGAVKTARANAERNNLNNMTVLASDSFSELDPAVTFDLIAANPPTHQGRSVVDDMIADSLARLNDDGTIMIVVEARLKPWVARDLQVTFGNHKILRRGPKNVVLCAVKSTKTAIIEA